ncbi:MAG: hypothetical protein LCI00_14025 [Chloroflexi bacterium]|nr:hypothetical protein [Chloroflexota bacterium]MCC6892217.1 hypothetical protein [Anaerolineae bacterium]
MSNLRRALPLNLALYGLYLLVAVVMTWPLVTQISTLFAGYPFGDAHEMTRHIWWFKHALQMGQPLIFQPLLGYPDGMQGVILWSDPLQFFPGWLFAFFMPLPAAYNLFVLLTLALNGWAAYWLVWRLTEVRSAGLLGGLAFMTAPVIQGHLSGGHGGLLVQWPLPLLAWSLLKVTSYKLPEIPTLTLPRKQGRGLPFNFSPLTFNSRLVTLDSLLATLFFFLTALGHTLQLIYAVLPLVAVLGLTVMVRRDWRALFRLIVVCALGTGLLVIFLLPVFSSTFGTSAYTAEGGGVEFSADLLGIVTPSFNHPLYGQLDYTRRVLGVNIVEGSVYVGIIAGLLAVVAVWQVKAARWWLVLAIVAWVLALGPVLKVFDQPVTVNLGGYDTYLTLPYALVYNLPGFSLARTPGRFGFLLALAVAVLVGYGWTVVSVKLKGSRQSSVASRQPKSILAVVIVGLFIIFDYQSFWSQPSYGVPTPSLPTYSAVIPQAVYDVARREDVRAVFDVPWDNLLSAKDALWLQTAHEKPIIAGQVTRRTPVSPAKLTILEQTLNPALLRESGADVVIVHKQYDAEGKLLASARQTLGEPTFEDAQIALFNVPDATESVDTLQIIPAFSTITDEHTLYVYAPQAGWLNVVLNHHDAPPRFRVSVDGMVLRTWAANAFAYEMPLSLPLATAGYHTITTETLLRCPEKLPAAATCAQAAPTMSYEAPSEWVFDPAAFDAPVTFERGVALAGSHLEVDAERLGVDLWWQFEQARGEGDIRFVKVLDAEGNQIAGDDHTLGVQTAGGAWVETVSLGLPADLSAGEYRVFVGWYTYPDLTRFPVLTAVEGAADGMARVGTFTITSQP